MQAGRSGPIGLLLGGVRIEGTPDQLRPALHQIAAWIQIGEVFMAVIG